MATPFSDIIRSLRSDRAVGLQRVNDFVQGQPHRISEFLQLAALELDREAMAMHTLLDLVPTSELTDVADAAVAGLASGRDLDGSLSAGLIAGLSLQAPHSLTEHLAGLWERRPNESSYYRAWPWRGADFDEVQRLSGLVGDTGTGFAAWEALLQVRTPAAWDFAVDALTASGWANPFTETRLLEVGIELGADHRDLLFAHETLHIDFLGGVIANQDSPNPTWHLDSEIVASGVFGGTLTSVQCKVCTSQLHRLLTLERPPLGVPGLPQVLVTCLSCVGWSEPVLFFVHDTETPRPAGPEIATRSPDFPAEPFPESDIAIRSTPDRWKVQDWATSNGKQNLNRVGGEPTWIQSPQYTKCPECAQTMRHVMQLDSLDFVGGPWWLWGSGGILYVQACAQCAITATFWQCT